MTRLDSGLCLRHVTCQVFVVGFPSFRWRRSSSVAVDPVHSGRKMQVSAPRCFVSLSCQGWTNLQLMCLYTSYAIQQTSQALEGLSGAHSLPQ